MPQSVREQIEEAAKAYKPDPAANANDAPTAAPAANEDWKLWNEDTPASAEKPGFFSSLADTVKQGPANLLGLGNTINRWVTTNPMKPGGLVSDLGNMTQQTIDMGKDAASHFRQGDVIGGTRRALNTAINAVAPGLGAQSEDAGRSFDKGDTAAGFGKTAGIGVNTVLGIKAPAMLRGAARTISGEALPNPFHLDPEVATEQVFRPGPADSEFPKIAPGAFSDVKAFGGAPPRGLFGRPTVGVKDLAPGGNTTAAIGAMQEQGLEPWLARARSINTQINGDQIVQATRSAIPELMWTKDPAGAAAIVREAQQTWGGKQFTPDQFRDFLRTGNAGLSRFYKQAPTGQQSAITSGSAPAINDAEISGIRRALYESLDPENGGAGPREIQERTGAVTNLRNAAERRSNAILGEKPVSPMAAAGRVIAAPFEAATLPFRSNPEAILNRAIHPILGRSDALIRGLYRQAPDAPPLPQPAPFAAPRGLVGQGPTITPPPEDASFVRSVPAMAQPPNPARAIPGPGQFNMGPTPVDPSGIRVTTGRPLMAPLDRQLPAGPSIRPPSELSGTPGDVLDTIPIKDPSTGRIYYAPRPRPIHLP